MPKFNGKEELYGRIHSHSSYSWSAGTLCIRNHRLPQEEEIQLVENQRGPYDFYAQSDEYNSELHSRRCRRAGGHKLEADVRPSRKAWAEPWRRAVDQTLFRCSYLFHGVHNRCCGTGRRSSGDQAVALSCTMATDVGQLQDEERSGVALRCDLADAHGSGRPIAYFFLHRSCALRHDKADTVILAEPECDRYSRQNDTVSETSAYRCSAEVYEYATL